MFGLDNLQNLQQREIEEMRKMGSNELGENKSKTMVTSSGVVLNVSKKILARQSIFRNIDCNVGHQIRRGQAFMTEEQIKNSTIYQKLAQRIEKAKKKQQDEAKQHERAMQRMMDEIKYLKASLQEDKLDIWQAKNEVMELEQLLEEQMEQYNALCEQLRAQEEQQDLEESQEDQQIYNDSSNLQSDVEFSETQTGRESSQSNKSDQREDLSKPTCSIKYFISNRTITSPGISNSNLEIGSAINPRFSKTNQPSSQIITHNEQQHSGTQHNLLSFKNIHDLGSTTKDIHKLLRIVQSTKT